MRGDNLRVMLSMERAYGSPPHARGQPSILLQCSFILRFTPACAGTTVGGREQAEDAPVHPRMRGDNPPTPPLRPLPTGSPPHARGQLEGFDLHVLPGRFTPACAGTTMTRPPRTTMSSVHPRMRGDNRSRCRISSSAIGSPPHARGQRRLVSRRTRGRRFTPACAGTTRRPSDQPQHPAVHPRMRGDNETVRPEERLGAGSPPHARGQLALGPLNLLACRFTPACAGTTKAVWEQQGPAAVHPRMRGDNLRPMTRKELDDGSPPHARGQPVCLARVRVVDRFTPACAGTTRTGCRRSMPGPVHPRMRGDNVTGSRPQLHQPGSPPHARGQRSRKAHENPHRRFTPACAGTTSARPVPRTQHSVHPRMRGDNSTATCFPLVMYGSPPHARGQLSFLPGEVTALRFTPACAGTTYPRPAPTARSTVHPRMRGDNRWTARFELPFDGSPPHARGQHAGQHPRGEAPRFTPACAGTTRQGP